MDCMQAMAARYSYRGMYRDEPVAREDLRAVMQAGLDAPSGCNAQTVRLIGVDDPALIAAFGEHLKPTFASAPAAVCVLGKPQIVYDERTFWVQDYAAAIENMLLAITALGYASCWVEGHVTGKRQVGRKMAELLGVADGYELVAYLPIGRPAEESTRAQRMPFAQRAWFNGYERGE